MRLKKYPLPNVLIMALVIFGLSAFCAHAELKVGAKAPDFTLKAATNGAVSSVTLSKALKSGPIVVYFYPKAFTSGCSLEAHEFSQSMPKFRAKHVSVIGISADTIEILKDFSKKDCAGQFAVASDKNLKVAAAYDAKIPAVPLAARISYIISQDGHIVFVHSDANAATHVSAILREIDKLP
jgi:peroxiredoxin